MIEIVILIRVKILSEIGLIVFVGIFYNKFLVKFVFD